jgi:hypothetical protein
MAPGLSDPVHAAVSRLPQAMEKTKATLTLRYRFTLHGSLSTPFFVCGDKCHEEMRRDDFQQ